MQILCDHPRAMNRPSCLIVGFLLVTCIAQRTFASDTCTIMYRVDATFEVSDTDLGKGDTTVEGIKGSLVVEYQRDKQGRVVLPDYLTSMARIGGQVILAGAKVRIDLWRKEDFDSLLGIDWEHDWPDWQRFLRGTPAAEKTD